MKMVTQRRSVAKSVGCFQRRLFVCLFVCLCVFICQHNNFRASEHRMMKLGGGCIVQKSWPSSNLGVIAPGCAPQKCGIGLRRWENQRRLSSCILVLLTLHVAWCVFVLLGLCCLLMFVGDRQTPVIVDADGYNSFDLVSSSEVVHQSEVSSLATRTCHC